jgi:transposase
VCGMSYSGDLTDEQWALLEPVFNAPGQRGPKHAPGLPSVVDAKLYVSHTGCRWEFRPESFGPWTRAWSQFRRSSRNGTWARALADQVDRCTNGRGEDGHPVCTAASLTCRRRSRSRAAPASSILARAAGGPSRITTRRCALVGRVERQAGGQPAQGGKTR